MADRYWDIVVHKLPGNIWFNQCLHIGDPSFQSADNAPSISYACKEISKRFISRSQDTCPWIPPYLLRNLYLNILGDDPYVYVRGINCGTSASNHSLSQELDIHKSPRIPVPSSFQARRPGKKTALITLHTHAKKWWHHIWKCYGNTLTCMIMLLLYFTHAQSREHIDRH